MSGPINSTLPPGAEWHDVPLHLQLPPRPSARQAVQRFRELGIVGEIGFKPDNFLGIPWRANNANDTEAVNRHTEYQIGIFAEPIYNTGVSLIHHWHRPGMVAYPLRIGQSSSRMPSRRPSCPGSMQARLK
jgi:hypothetical protein